MAVDLVGIGDSIMAGAGVTPVGPADWLASFHTARVSNKGVSGNTTTQIQARFTTDVVNQQPRYALIEGGINDIAGGSQATFLSNWDSMLTACKNAGIFALALLMLPATSKSNADMTTRDTWTAALIAQIQGATYASNTLIINVEATVGQFRVGGSPGNLWDIKPAYNFDGLHFNADGYRVIGQAIDTQFLAAGLTMASSASRVFEVRAATGNDNNGGAFVAGATGTDRSQQTSPQVVIDNATITTSITANVITFTGYVPSAADVGNVVQMLTGTNVTAGFYEVVSQTATTWTVAGAVSLPTSGTTTNATGNMGGALATLGKLAGAMIASNLAYVTGAFTTTATITFAQTVPTPNGSSPLTRIVGYGSVRGDTGHATLTLSTNTGIIGISATGIGFSVEQLDVNCASLGTSKGIQSTGVAAYFTNCKVSNFTLGGIICTGASSTVINCEATGGTAAATAAIDTSGASSSAFVGHCFSHDNACPGIKIGVNSGAYFNISANNSGASSDGLQTSNASFVVNNTVHNNGRDGIRNLSANAFTLVWRNNILSSNTGFGASGSTGTAYGAAAMYDGNAYFSNTAGARNLMDSTSGIFGVTPYVNVRDVTLTGSPYVGGTTGTTANFALNNTSGAGAACRAAGSPASWPGETGTTGFLDMGAVQTRGSNTSPNAGGTPGIVMATG
jgi:lysophospholipase L1-like esterase